MKPTQRIKLLGVKILGVVAGIALWTIGKTNSLSLIEHETYEAILTESPVIVTMWHGEHFLIPFAKRKAHRVKVLISKSVDGEINAIAAKMLGMEIIRGSGGRMQPGLGTVLSEKEKGGARGLMQMLSALEQGVSVSMTADIPRKNERKASKGIITLARLSGRPIVPVGFGSSRYTRLKNKEKTVITLPFGKGVFKTGEMLYVPADASEADQEELRLQLEISLNNAYEAAYQAVKN